MSNDATPRLHLPYLAASQAQKHLTLNEALGLLDGLIACAVQSRTLAVQPAAPADGALYILPAGPTGDDWSVAGAGALMRFEIGAWTELARAPGQLVYVRDEAALLLFDGADWVFAGEALGARAKLNKAATAGTASVLFQKGFSGRAEIGLVGDDALTVKVSADGASLVEALKVEPGGQVRLPKKPMAVAFRTSGAVTVGAAVVGLACDNAVLDAGGDYDPTTGVFTCPAQGRYRVAANIMLAASNAAGVLMYVYLRKNGAVLGGPIMLAQQPVAGALPNVPVETAVACVAGETLQIGLLRAGATDVVVFGDNYTRVTFEYLG